MSCLVLDRKSGGFSFENCYRNKVIEQKGFKLPKAVKTGTTICGVVFKNGIVLGADTRATEGSVVAEKNCSKIHRIAENIYCCGAGTAADTQMVTLMISSQVELHRLNTGRTPRVISPLRLLKRYLYQYQGYVGAALVLGGVDSTGPHLYSIAPHGSTDKLPYITMGSGSLACMSVLESRFKFDMEQDEAVKLVRDGIAAGIFNDMGSGSNVDICIITKDGTTYIRSYDEANVKGKRAEKYNPPEGTTSVLHRSVHHVEFDVVTTRVVRDIPAHSVETMDLS
ncbi:Proteasome subunit beta type-7 [Schistosoma haematobium]|uniref:Proteasome subunit beta n=2 Tax=Schistosoma haematobium TaxID=6185 RepID=A0A922LT82_SCHHA|nr:Proteasome subunit beta type-7 [Schistosoma haematobium]KAH9592690.1 Proteasome subunit beta type-7 [Schistosoma haematobium]CAH8678526.1 unnamed protein product [Schistosoma haematobium]CAH8681239.1 unnamed protein product [Schistosoma haematobium]